MGARYDNIGGVQHKISKRYDNINGVFRPVSKRFSNIAGVWRQGYSGEIATVTVVDRSYASESYINDDGSGYLKLYSSSGKDQKGYLFLRFTFLEAFYADNQPVVELTPQGYFQNPLADNARIGLAVNGSYLGSGYTVNIGDRMITSVSRSGTINSVELQFVADLDKISGDWMYAQLSFGWLSGGLKLFGVPITGLRIV